jgi:hypothetical protein
MITTCWKSKITDMKTKAQAVKDAVGTVYKDDWCKKAGWEIDKPTVIAALREVINQLQQSPGVVMCYDILELCDELESL